MTATKVGVIDTSRVARDLQELAEHHMANLGHQRTCWEKFEMVEHGWRLRCVRCGYNAEIYHQPGTASFAGRWYLELPERLPHAICTPFTEVCRARVDRRALGGDERRVYKTDADTAMALPTPRD